MWALLQYKSGILNSCNVTLVCFIILVLMQLLLRPSWYYSVKMKLFSRSPAVTEDILMGGGGGGVATELGLLVIRQSMGTQSFV